MGAFTWSHIFSELPEMKRLEKCSENKVKHLIHHNKKKKKKSRIFFNA